MARPKGSALRIRSIRGATYKTGKLLGDLSAITRGQVGGRVTRRLAGKVTGRGLKIFN